MNAVKYGDKAGEHLRMRRGKYGAMFHVVLGFLIAGGTVGTALVLLWALVLEPPGLKPWLEDRGERNTAFVVGCAFSFLVGLVVAGAAFRDRWRCIEAYASRYCSGIAQVSLAYVPLIAAGYGFVRGVRKLRGTER